MLAKKRSNKAKSKREKKEAKANNGEQAGEQTDSESDFDNIQTQPTGAGGTNFLSEYLTLGELGGRIPPSLLVNVSFEKFAKENGFDTLDFEQQ